MFGISSSSTVRHHYDIVFASVTRYGTLPSFRNPTLSANLEKHVRAINILFASWKKCLLDVSAWFRSRQHFLCQYRCLLTRICDLLGVARTHTPTLTHSQHSHTATHTRLLSHYTPTNKILYKLNNALTLVRSVVDSVFSLLSVPSLSSRGRIFLWLRSIFLISISTGNVMVESAVRWGAVWS